MSRKKLPEKFKGMTKSEIYDQIMNMVGMPTTLGMATNTLLARAGYHTWPYPTGPASMPYGQVGLGQGGWLIDPPWRQLARECNWPEYMPVIAQYRYLFDRVGLATRIVSVFPDECWSTYPDLFERADARHTAFERAWEALNDRLNCWHYLHRGDVLSGIGRYGVLFLGIDDGLDPSHPAEGLNSYGMVTRKPGQADRRLMFVRAFSEDLAEIMTYERDPNNPRFGQPNQYLLKFLDPTNAIQSDTQGAPIGDIRVHWSRIVHLADNRTNSEVMGNPRLLNTIDRVLDVRKILGSSGEMFYRGGFPGIAFEAYPEITSNGQIDMGSIKAEIDAYAQGMQRYLRLIGMTAKSLLPQVADPGPHLTEQYRFIASTIKVPMRILLGSEAAEKASSQDSENWNQRVTHRNNFYVMPWVIRPFVDRIQALGCLPTVEKYFCQWPDLNNLSDKDKADVAMKKVQSVFQYVTGGCEEAITMRDLQVHFLDFDIKTADAIVAAASANTAADKLTTKVWTQKKKPAAGGSSTGTDSAGNAGGRTPRNSSGPKKSRRGNK